jgi:hypothetical protein
MKAPAAVAWEKEQAFSMEEVELEKPYEERGSDPRRGGRGLPHGPDRPRPGIPCAAPVAARSSPS